MIRKQKVCSLPNHTRIFSHSETILFWHAHKAGNTIWSVIPVFILFSLPNIVTSHFHMFWCPIRCKGPWSQALFCYLCFSSSIWSQACIKWISSLVLIGPEFSIVNVHSTQTVSSVTLQWVFIHNPQSDDVYFPIHRYGVIAPTLRIGWDTAITENCCHSDRNSFNNFTSFVWTIRPAVLIVFRNK